jgi:hypothetical protein
MTDLGLTPSLNFQFKPSITVNTKVLTFTETKSYLDIDVIHTWTEEGGEYHTYPSDPSDQTELIGAVMTSNTITITNRNSDHEAKFRPIPIQFEGKLTKKVSAEDLKIHMYRGEFVATIHDQNGKPTVIRVPLKKSTENGTKCHQDQITETIWSRITDQSLFEPEDKQFLRFKIATLMRRVPLWYYQI